MTWCELTYDEEQDTFDLPVKQLRKPQAFTDARGIQHPAGVFRSYSLAELAFIGVIPINIQPYDQKLYIPSVSSDVLEGDNTVSRTYTLILQPIDKLKDVRKAEIERKAHEVSRGGIVFNTKSFRTDADFVDFTLLLATAVSDGETLPAGFNLKDLDGNRIPVTDANIKEFRNAVAQHFALTIKNGENHEDAIDALLVQQEVVDYDILTGWPINPS